MRYKETILCIQKYLHYDIDILAIPNSYAQNLYHGIHDTTFSVSVRCPDKALVADMQNTYIPPAKWEPI